VTLLVMTPGIVALGLAVGVIYPQFGADSAPKVAASIGGLVYMILCMAFIGVIVCLEAWPVYVVFSHRLHEMPISSATQAGVAFSLTAALLLAIGVFAVSTRIGIRRLSALEI
jgi:hypothetical protein